MTRSSSDTLLDRFWSKVSISRQCWLWTAYKDAEGYGHIRHNDRMRFSHHIAWLLWRGPIPDGMKVCHSCDNPSCVNPEHLFLGTQQDNMIDCTKKGRHGDVSGERNGRARLTYEQVEQIRRSYTGRYGELTYWATKFNVSIGAIRYAALGKTWRNHDSHF